MRHGQQATTDKPKAVAAQQVQGHCAQQGQNLNTIALAVAGGILTEVGVTEPVPLVFDCPPRPDQL